METSSADHTKNIFWFNCWRETNVCFYYTVNIYILISFQICVHRSIWRQWVKIDFQSFLPLTLASFVFLYVNPNDLIRDSVSHEKYLQNKGENSVHQIVVKISYFVRIRKYQPISLFVENFSFLIMNQLRLNNSESNKNISWIFYDKQNLKQISTSGKPCQANLNLILSNFKYISADSEIIPWRSTEKSIFTYNFYISTLI